MPTAHDHRLRFIIAALGQDGHQAVPSWGEIDPEFGDTRAVLATRWTAATSTTRART